MKAYWAHLLVPVHPDRPFRPTDRDRVPLDPDHRFRRVVTSRRVFGDEMPDLMVSKCGSTGLLTVRDRDGQQSASTCRPEAE